MFQENLDELLKPLTCEARALTPRRSPDAAGASTETKFGGSPYAEAHEAWPQCPTCQQELVFVTQLGNSNTDELLVLFYCFECFPWGLSDEAEGQWVIRSYAAPSSERLVPISPAQALEFVVTPCSVSEKRVHCLPDWEGLDAQSEEASDLCCEIDDDSPWEAYEAAVVRNHCLNDYASLMGGYPRWVQGEATPSCKQCAAQMQFVAQIDSEEEADLMWGDLGLVYLFRCPTHPDVFHLELQCH